MSTSSPWTITEETNGYLVQAGPRGVVARVDNYADAALIAATPMVLTLLETLARIFETHTLVSKDLTVVSARRLAYLNMIKAVVAQARQSKPK